MILALGATIAIAFVSLAAARLLETHVRVQQLFDETDRDSQEMPDVVPSAISRSLLALSTVHSLAPDDFRAPVPDESSSSVSTRRAQLKTPGQAP